MNLHGLNIAMGLAAVRHALRLQQDNSGRLRRPLNIITGKGDGLQLQQATTNMLNERGIFIHHLEE